MIQKWHSLCRMVVYLLGEICFVDLPQGMLVPSRKVIFSEIIEFMVNCCEFKSDGKENQYIQAQ